MSIDPHITKRELEEGLKFLALIMDKHGQVYWPLFEKLETDLRQNTEREEKIRLRLSSYR